MDEIKIYKKLLNIELKDGTILTSEKTIDDLENYLNNCKDICKIDGILFNKYEFKKAYESKIDGIRSYILTKPKDIQEILKAREKEKKSRIGKGFESIEEIENYLKSKNLII